MRSTSGLLVLWLLAGCGDDTTGPCGRECGTGYVCEATSRTCVPVGADGGADADSSLEAEATVDADVDAPGETPADVPGEDAPGETLGPCAAAGGTCRALVSGCARCAEGEEPAPSTVRCPPENYCCVPRTVAPPFPACLEAGGVCYPVSSGSECPVGWFRDDLSCGGPGGCCVPSDGC